MLHVYLEQSRSLNGRVVVVLLVFFYPREIADLRVLIFRRSFFSGNLLTTCYNLFKKGGENVLLQ